MNKFQVKHLEQWFDCQLSDEEIAKQIEQDLHDNPEGQVAKFMRAHSASVRQAMEEFGRISSKSAALPNAAGNSSDSSHNTKVTPKSWTFKPLRDLSIAATIGFVAGLSVLMMFSQNRDRNAFLPIAVGVGYATDLSQEGLEAIEIQGGMAQVQRKGELVTKVTSAQEGYLGIIVLGEGKAAFFPKGNQSQMELSAFQPLNYSLGDVGEFTNGKPATVIVLVKESIWQDSDWEVAQRIINTSDENVKPFDFSKLTTDQNGVGQYEFRLIFEN